MDIEYSSESEEVYTYLLEYLTQPVMEELKTIKGTESWKI